MPVPKKRTSKSKRNMRRAHDKKERTYSVVCPSCGDAMLRHRACPGCGEYRGRKVLDVSDEL